MRAAWAAGPASGQITAPAQPLPGGVPDIRTTALARARSEIEGLPIRFLGFFPQVRSGRIGFGIGFRRGFEPLILILHWFLAFSLGGFIAQIIGVHLGAGTFVDLSGRIFQVGFSASPAGIRVPFILHLPRFPRDR